MFYVSGTASEEKDVVFPSSATVSETPPANNKDVKKHNIGFNIMMPDDRQATPSPKFKVNIRLPYWSALMILNAVNTMMISVESGPSLSLLFIKNQQKMVQLSQFLRFLFKMVSTMALGTQHSFLILAKSEVVELLC